MGLKIYNSLSGRLEVFTPLNQGKVGIYVCGITPYSRCHIGHARTAMAFDMVVRYLNLSGYKVNYIRNITDVDDKIINSSNARNEPWEALANRYIAAMHKEYGQLGMQSPTNEKQSSMKEPRVSRHIGQIIALIQRLLDGDYAYTSAGNVFFKVRSYADYGRLSHRSLEDMQAGARVAVDPHKDDPLDFALWKAAEPGAPSWDAPWGAGRPGWHIECSAMSMHYLGESFDIHGGGGDLKFPHHENEIAQSEAVTGQPLARYWMHSGTVDMGTEKMSKSLGNVVCLDELLAHWHPETIRYFLLSSHYRSPMQFSPERLQEADSALRRLYQAARVAPGDRAPVVSRLTESPREGRSRYVRLFYSTMDSDFNTPQALKVLFELAHEVHREQQPERAVALAGMLRDLAQPFGLLQEEPEVFLRWIPAQNQITPEIIEEMIAARRDARERHDYAAADQIRDDLLASGIHLLDGQDGTHWQRGSG